MLSDNAKAALQAHQKATKGKPVARPQRNPMERWEDEPTRKNSIHAKCWDCQGGTATKIRGIRLDIKECHRGPRSDRPCPLWEWRPFKK